MKVCPDCGASHAESESFCQTDGHALVDSEPDPLLGEMVGSYRITRVLGAGGMGRVYLGSHPRIGSRVAIKVLSAECSVRRDLVDRFFAEARAVNHVRHEGIVNILDLAMLGDGRPYIVMEYLDGQPLSELIARSGALPLGSLCQMVLEILDALGSAHDKGVVHRDLKPDNVFVTPHGRPKLLDFGIAKLLPDFGGEMQRATRTGMVLGTPTYMAPEQITGGPITAATDIYSVGVMLFEAATGRPPFTGDSLFALLQQHVAELPPPARALRADLPVELEHIIATALAKDPNHRFATAPAMAKALTHVAHALPPAAWAAIGSRSSAIITSPPPMSPGGAAAHGASDRAIDHDTRRDPVPGFLDSPGVPDSANEIHRAAAAPALVAEARRTGARTIAIAAIGAVAAVAAIIVAAVVLRDPDTEVAMVEVASAEPSASEGETAAAPADKPTETRPAEAKPAEAKPADTTTAELPPAETTAAETKPAETKPAEPVHAVIAAAPAGGSGGGQAPLLQKVTPKPTAPAPAAPKPTGSAPIAAAPPSSRAADPKPVSDNAESTVTFINTAALATKITGIKPMTLASEWGGKTRFDAIAFLPRAQKLARQLMSDAVLVQFEVEAVYPDGMADMRYGSADFWFRSPSRSGRPADVPRGVEVDIACMVYVEVTSKAIEVYPVTREECGDRKRPRPRCSLAQVWDKAIARGARNGDVVATINYLWDGWTLGIGDSEYYESFPDDC